MNCPACSTDTLAPYTDPTIGLEVDACGACSGVWFDANELSRFLDSAKLKQTFHWDDRQRKGEATFTINTAARSCPRCSLEMEDKLFGGVTLDRCPQCKGLWFDGGELQQVVGRYRKGAHGDREIAQELRAGLGEPDAVETPDAKKAALLDSVKDFLASLGDIEEA